MVFFLVFNFPFDYFFSDSVLEDSTSFHCKLILQDIFLDIFCLYNQFMLSTLYTCGINSCFLLCIPVESIHAFYSVYLWNQFMLSTLYTCRINIFLGKNRLHFEGTNII